MVNRLCPSRRITLLLWLAVWVELWPALGQQSTPAPQQSTPPLTITTSVLPPAIARQEFQATLDANGGTPPLTWSISDGKLPPGLQLDPSSGAISGTPVETGSFRFTVTVTDSAQPAHDASREFTLGSTAPLMLKWGVLPKVDSDQMNGSIKVSNGTKDVFDQTVIVVAVNEHGKAFALGYERFDLNPGTSDQEIKFGSSLPRGQYVVHADAVAEVAAKNAIYRVRLRTPQPLQVTGP